VISTEEIVVRIEEMPPEQEVIDRPEDSATITTQVVAIQDPNHASSAGSQLTREQSVQQETLNVGSAEREDTSPECAEAQGVPNTRKIDKARPYGEGHTRLG